MKSLLSVCFLLSFCPLFAQNADDIQGLWLVEDKDAYIRIYEKRGKYFGKVTWIEEPYDENGKPVTDPEGNPILEMEIMKDFVFEEDEWVDGTVYDAETGKTYYGSMELENHNTLNLRGSLDSFGLIGRSETWTRLKERGDK
ncbi:MAG: DUF2147 domain-containing protein [Cryomorphaceae bacterium]